MATFVVGFGVHVLNGALFTLQYDVLKDFAPVALLRPTLSSSLPGPDCRPRTNELITWLKANPGKASQACGHW
jgi:hypothetical protein